MEMTFRTLESKTPGGNRGRMVNWELTMIFNFILSSGKLQRVSEGGA